MVRAVTGFGAGLEEPIASRGDDGREDRVQRSIGRTEVYLDCLEILRAVWTLLPAGEPFEGLNPAAQLIAYQQVLIDARAEMLSRMQALRDQIAEEHALRRQGRDDGSR